MSYRKKSEILEDEIEATRSRIEARMGQLDQSAGPVGLINSALGTEAGSVPETLSALVDRAKANPISALLIGVGVAGLLTAERGESAATRPAEDTLHSDDDRTLDERLAQNAAALKADAKGAARDVVADARQAASTVRETASTATKKSREAVADAGDAIGEAARAAPRELKARGSQFVEWVQENPIPAGLMALAAGAGIASLFTGRNTRAPVNRLRASHRLHEMARDEQPPTDRVHVTAAEPEVAPKTFRSGNEAEAGKIAESVVSERAGNLKPVRDAKSG